jgi:putative ABC transport system permease protein
VNPAGGGAIVATIPIDHGFEEAAPAYVATPELLAHYRIDPATIDPATDLLTSLSGPIVLLDVTTRPDPESATTPTQREHLATESEAPVALITQAAMDRHGWQAVSAGWFVETPDAISTSDLAAATRAAGEAGLALETHNSESGLVALGRGATLAGVVLALAILAMTIGLLRGEASGDMRTLTAVGATARTRRSVTASAAGALAFAGAIISMIGAYIALVAAYRSDLSRLSSPPIANLLVIAIGLPLVAAAVAWTLGGRDSGSMARQPT